MFIYHIQYQDQASSHLTASEHWSIYHFVHFSWPAHIDRAYSKVLNTIQKIKWEDLISIFLTAFKIRKMTRDADSWNSCMILNKLCLFESKYWESSWSRIWSLCLHWEESYHHYYICWWYSYSQQQQAVSTADERWVEKTI